MDAFFASVEQAANPIYKGKPLLVGSRGRKFHTVVAACSYEAKAFGIHSGMPTKAAYRLCPWASFVPADSAKYVYTSDKIEEILRDYSDQMERASIDEFYLDLGQRSISAAAKTAEEIKRRIKDYFSITASVGIAKNWLLAKLASKINKPDGLTLIDDSNFEQVLRKVSLDKLCGMGGKNGQILIAKGLKTCWDLYRDLPEFFNNNPGKF